MQALGNGPIGGGQPITDQRARLADLDRKLAALHRRSRELRPPRTEAEQLIFEKASAEIDAELRQHASERTELLRGIPLVRPGVTIYGA